MSRSWLVGAIYSPEEGEDERAEEEIGFSRLGRAPSGGADSSGGGRRSWQGAAAWCVPRVPGRGGSMAAGSCTQHVGQGGQLASGGNRRRWRNGGKRRRLCFQQRGEEEGIARVVLQKGKRLRVFYKYKIFHCFRAHMKKCLT